MHVSRGGDRRKRATLQFVKEGKLQRDAEIGRLRVCPAPRRPAPPWMMARLPTPATCGWTLFILAQRDCEIGKGIEDGEKG